ncbi:MAG: lysophospholipid acyltransferase family protein [Planctomycetota bacterium]
MLIALVAHALGRLAPDTAARMGAALGILAWRLGLRRRVVCDNLLRTLALRGWQRRDVARRCYASVGATLMQLGSIGARGVEELSITAMNPHWQELVARRHPGAVLLTLHQGSWDINGWAMARRFPRLLAYATAQATPAVDAWINACRARLGMEVVLVRSGDRRGALRVVRGLRGGGLAVGMLADQGPRPEVGSAARFFGQPAWCHHGPVFLARKAGVPIVPTVCLRRGWLSFSVFMGRPLHIDGMSDAQAVQLCMDQIAVLIRAAPGQYFWHHKRFKRAMSAMPPAGVVVCHGRGMAVLDTADGLDLLRS